VDVSEDEERIILATLDPMAALAGANAERFAELTEALNVRSDALRDLIEQLQRPVMKAGNTDPDALPDNVPARAKLGDVWALGEHRLGCGDATKGEDVVRVLPTREQWPMLMVTDPPYGVEYDPAWRDEAAAKGQIAYAASRVGEVANDERVDWTPAWELFPGDVAYVWHAGRHASEVQASMQRTGFEIRNQVIWAKAHSPITRGHYRWRHEPCWYAVRKGATAHWIGDRTQSTLWEIALDPNVAGGHSTQKPVECMARPLRNHKGDVYDPFLGSGTTLIAAEQLGRRCYAIEIEPKYVDVAIARWEAFTGKKAEKCQ
jgi:DNA modification methylase